MPSQILLAMPQEFLSIQRFEDHVKETADRHHSIKEEIKLIKAAVETKVSQSTFTWTLGILMTILIGILGVIYSRLELTYRDVFATKEAVANISGKLAPYNIEYKD